MDLYGDLPPASGDGESDIASKPRLISLGALPSHPQPPKTGIVHEQPKKNVALKQEASVSSTPAKSTPPQTAPTNSKPFLTFKPRQTKVTAASSSATVKPHHQSSNVSSSATPAPVSSSLVSTTYSETVTRRKLDASPVEPTDPSPPPPLSPQTIPQYHEYAATYEVEDAYDPSAPNDYMAYCEERKEKQRLFQLEITNKRRLEELERERLAMEKERREASERGDIAKLQQLGGGRGRNVSNLPAWMTQDQNRS